MPRPSLDERIGARFLDAGGALYNVKHPQFGATGDGSTDDSSAFAKAEAEGDELIAPAGRYLIARDVTLSKSWTFVRGATLRPTRGVTVTIAGGMHAGPHPVFDLSAGGYISLARVSEALPEWFGAQGNGGYTDDVSIAAGSSSATAPQSRPWTQANVGQAITIKDAGGVGASLRTTIEAVRSEGEITLARPASREVRAGWAAWGTDSHAGLAASVRALRRPMSGRQGNQEFGPVLRLEGAGVYYSEDVWEIDRPLTILGHGAVVTNTVLVGNAFPVYIEGLSVIGSPSAGWRYRRVQGSQFHGLRALGCQEHGHVVGGAGSAANYGSFYGIYARACGGHGLFLDGSKEAVNANKFYGPVMRENGGYGIYATNPSTGGLDYNDFFSPQIEGNAQGSVKCLLGNDWSFFGGHYVDNDSGTPPRVMDFSGRRNRLFGGRVIGDQSALAGVSYIMTVFSRGGMRSNADQ
jgi:hypothetical protein